MFTKFWNTLYIMTYISGDMIQHNAAVAVQIIGRVQRFELGSPNALARHGWTRNSLKTGETLTVQGYMAKDGAHLANARSVTTADGKKVFAGSSNDGGPTQ